MNKLHTPLTATEVQEYLKLAYGYELDFEILLAVYKNKTKSKNLNSVLSVADFNGLYTAIADGYRVRAVTTNKSINVLTAECESENDVQRIKLSFIYDGECVDIVISMNNAKISLDRKVVRGFNNE